MIVYECTACTHRDGGRFRFAVSYPKDDATAEATRCPRCGMLVDDEDVRIVKQNEVPL